MLEVLRYGAIPVILSDGLALPFHHVIDWESFSVVVPEHEVDTVDGLRRLVARLRALDADAIAARMRTAFERWLGHGTDRMDAFALSALVAAGAVLARQYAWYAARA